MKKKQNTMVAEVSENTMLGSNLRERRINAYLTRSFIGSSDLPADECLAEALLLDRYFTSVKDQSRFVDFLEMFLSYTFGDGTKKAMFNEAALELYEVMKKTENTFQ